jgi:hypothetical protein
MASPLLPYANATLRFTLPTAELATADSVTGNIVPVTETIEHRAFLKAGGARAVSLPGVDRYVQTWSGYAVEELDSRIRIGLRGEIEVDGEPAGECIVTALRGPFGAEGIGATIRQVLGEAIAVERIWSA